MCAVCDDDFSQHADRLVLPLVVTPRARHAREDGTPFVTPTA